MSLLLDGNVLVALAVRGHVHHERVHDWWPSAQKEGFATCPITEGTLLRLALRSGASIQHARRTLHDIRALPEHTFWPDTLSYDEVDLRGVIGHRQVTDAYLAQLARVNNGRLATLDEGLAALHDDVGMLIPTR